MARPRPELPLCLRWAGDSGLVLDGSTPEQFESWCRHAGHEWAEGASLEPDRRRGTAYLEALERALDASSPPP